MEKGQDRLTFRMKRQYRRTQANLVLERAWSSARIFLCLIGLFLAVSFAGFWETIHPVLHFLGLVVFAFAAGYGLLVFWRLFFWPDEDEVWAALEACNGFTHRPLRSMLAEPVFHQHREAISRKLWNRHRKDLLELVKQTRAGWPCINLASGDVYALRSAVILLVFTGFFIGGSEPVARLQAALVPVLSGGDSNVELDVWVTPPVYTRQPPVLLTRHIVSEGQENGTVAVSFPAGSKLVARVTGGNEDAPVLTQSTEEYAFDWVEGTSFELELSDVKSGLTILEKDGEVLAEWEFTVIPDIIPVAEMTALPEVTDRSAFRLLYQAADDYGVVDLHARIKRNGDEAGLKLKLPMVSGKKETEGKSYHDLTAHPWAGLTVDLDLAATDEIGQEGTSKSISFTLPERLFTHPLARALIEQRKKLVADPVENKRSVAVALSAIALLPESLNNDFVVIMTVAAARATLVYGDDGGSVAEVVELLWDAALRLENGDLSAAEVALREAERALMEALNNNASDGEIKELVENLKTAMNNFLEALAQNSQSATSEFENSDNGGQNIGRQDLEKLLNKVDQFARSGARDAARELLSELQEILENLQAAKRTPPSAEQQAGQQMLDQLGDMMRRQQELLDETFRQSGEKNRQTGQQDQESKEGDREVSSEHGPLKGMSNRQEALRQMLGEMMGKLGLQGEIPRSLGKAERAMNAARQALEQGSGKQATEAQSQALDELRKGAEGLAEQMMSQGGGGQSGGSAVRRAGQDPLGRPSTNGNAGSPGNQNRFQLKDRALSRARLIQDELRRRLSDPSRGELERDYLRRLMQRFR